MIAGKGRGACVLPLVAGALDELSELIVWDGAGLELGLGREESGHGHWGEEDEEGGWMRRVQRQSDHKPETRD